jgi:hypothetical protein
MLPIAGATAIICQGRVSLTRLKVVRKRRVSLTRLRATRKKMVRLTRLRVVRKRKANNFLGWVPDDEF